MQEERKETFTGEGNFEVYGNMKKGERLVKNPRGRSGAWRRERWNRKKRRREGGREGRSNAFWQRWVQDGFMVTSWLIFEESIDRRAVHLSLDTHVGEQAERSCPGTHTGRFVNSLWIHPKICTDSAHSCFYFLFLSLLFPSPLFLLELKVFCLSVPSFVLICFFAWGLHSGICSSVNNTSISLLPWLTHFPASSIPPCVCFYFKAVGL